MELAAQSLLAVSKARRAGVWLLDEKETESNGAVARGRVVDLSGVPPPEEWNHLDLPAPFLGSLLRSKEPVIEAIDRGDRNSVASFPAIGPYAGAKRVVWLPLRVQDTPLGLGMVADSRYRSLANASALRTPLRYV